MSEYTMTNQEMIDELVMSYPSPEDTRLTEAIDKSIDLLEKEQKEVKEG